MQVGFESPGGPEGLIFQGSQELDGPGRGRKDLDMCSNLLGKDSESRHVHGEPEPDESDSRPPPKGGVTLHSVHVVLQDQVRTQCFALRGHTGSPGPMGPTQPTTQSVSVTG